MQVLSRAKVHGDDITVLGVEWWMLAGGVTVACAICSVGLIFSGIMRWPGYWREPLRANLLVAIGTGRTPRERSGEPHTAYTLGMQWPSGPGTNIRRRLRNKAICNNPSVVAAIGDWIGNGVPPGSPVH